MIEKYNEKNDGRKCGSCKPGDVRVSTALIVGWKGQVDGSITPYLIKGPVRGLETK